MHCSENIPILFYNSSCRRNNGLILTGEKKLRREIRRFKKMNAYDGYSILSSNYGFRTKKTVYPSFQHKTDYPYATFDKMVCPSYT